MLNFIKKSYVLKNTVMNQMNPNYKIGFKCTTAILSFNEQML